MRAVPAITALCLSILSAGCATPQSQRPAVSVQRLDCGSFDIKDYDGLGPRRLSNGCYLVRHGDTFMLWDAGLEAALVGNPEKDDDQVVALDEALGPQLERMRLRPEDISIVGISHFHGDHLGQARLFAGARLLIGAQDLAYLREHIRNRAALPWLDGTGTTDEVSGDRDVFGDGSVVMLSTPGHTPGHHSLLVRMAVGAIILTGDAAHLREQLASGKPPGNGTDLEQAKKSLDRLLALAARENARIIVQHDPIDIPALPAVPAA